MIDLTIRREPLERAISRARKRKILIPTFRKQMFPDLIPQKVKEKLKGIGLWDISPLNLFRISWKNEPVAHGGQFGNVNYLEFPPALTDAVIDGPQSVAYDEAENRLHAQKAVMALTMR